MNAKMKQIYPRFSEVSLRYIQLIHCSLIVIKGMIK